MTTVERIKELMLQNGDTITALARSLCLPRTTVDSIFKRRTGGMTVETAYKIASYYGVTVDYLVSGSDTLTAKGMSIGSLYDKLDNDGKELINSVINHEYNRCNRASTSSAPVAIAKADEASFCSSDNSADC